MAISITFNALLQHLFSIDAQPAKIYESRYWPVLGSFRYWSGIGEYDSIKIKISIWGVVGKKLVASVVIAFHNLHTLGVKGTVNEGVLQRDRCGQHPKLKS